MTTYDSTGFTGSKITGCDCACAGAGSGGDVVATFELIGWALGGSASKIRSFSRTIVSETRRKPNFPSALWSGNDVIYQQKLESTLSLFHAILNYCGSLWQAVATDFKTSTPPQRLAGYAQFFPSRVATEAEIFYQYWEVDFVTNDYCNITDWVWNISFRSTLKIVRPINAKCFGAQARALRAAGSSVLFQLRHYWQKEIVCLPHRFSCVRQF